MRASRESIFLSQGKSYSLLISWLEEVIWNNWVEVFEITVSPPPSTILKANRTFLLTKFLFFSFLPRVDVTEVQIAITLLLLISAFGGTAIWDYKVSVLSMQCSCGVWSSCWELPVPTVFEAILCNCDQPLLVL